MSGRHGRGHGDEDGETVGTAIPVTGEMLAKLLGGRGAATPQSAEERRAAAVESYETILDKASQPCTDGDHERLHVALTQAVEAAFALEVVPARLRGAFLRAWVGLNLHRHEGPDGVERCFNGERFSEALILASVVVRGLGVTVAPGERGERPEDRLPGLYL